MTARNPNALTPTEVAHRGQQALKASFKDESAYRKEMRRRAAHARTFVKKPLPFLEWIETREGRASLRRQARIMGTPLAEVLASIKAGANPPGRHTTDPQP